MQSSSLEIYSKPDQSPILSKKVSDLERREVGIIIAYICAVTGITKATSDFAASVTVDFVINKYPSFGILEFKTAFDMYVQGRLIKRDGESHYNTISAAFIGSVMQKYQTYRIIEMRNVENGRAEKPKPKATYNKKDYESAYNYALGFIAKNKKLPIGGNWLLIYDHFKVKSMGWYGLSDRSRINAKGEYMEKVRKQLKAEARAKDVVAVQAQTALNNTTAFATQCKMRYIKEELEKLIK